MPAPLPFGPDLAQAVLQVLALRTGGRVGEPVPQLVLFMP
jgi:hypothetical protein